MLVFIAFITVGVTLLLLREGLILLGLYKEPILRRFQRYGDTETFHYGLPWFLLWMACFVGLLDWWLGVVWGSATGLGLLGVLLLAVAYITYRFPSSTGQQEGVFLGYPRWLSELRPRTTRTERRRIAYMWLRLPSRLRMTYNGNDRAFLEWADMVILSTLL